MNTNYIRKQLKQAIEILGDINLTGIESYNSKLNKQKKLNKAYDIIFELNNYIKMEEDQ